MRTRIDRTHSGRSPSSGCSVPLVLVLVERTERIVFTISGSDDAAHLVIVGDGPRALRRWFEELESVELANVRDCLDPHGADLVLGRADERVADVVRQPVHLRSLEVERHPDEPRVDAVGDGHARFE